MAFFKIFSTIWSIMFLFTFPFIIQPFNDLEMFGERFPLVAGLNH